MADTTGSGTAGDGYRAPDLYLQYMIGLESLWAGLGKSDADIAADPSLSRISTLLASCRAAKGPWDQDWRNAWLAERLLAAHISEPVLLAEGERRVAELAALALPGAATIRTRWEEAVAKPDVALQRALYISMLDEIQLHSARRRLNRRVRNEVSGKIATLAIVLAIIAVFPYLTVPGTCLSASRLFVADAGAKAVVHMYGLYTAISFGLLGALFSRLNSFQTHFVAFDYEQGVGIYNGRAIFVRLLFGMIGSIVLFYAIFGNLIGGNLFPGIGELKLDPAAWPGANEAKLIVWSFLGGFSERLVPDFLQRTEARAPAADRPNE